MRTVRPRQLAPRVGRFVATAVIVAGLGLTLASCTTTIGAIRSTQLSLFCLVHRSDTRGAVYRLVSNPTAESSNWSRVPALFAPSTQTESSAVGDSWAEWTGPPNSYLVVFHNGQVRSVERGHNGRVLTNWTC